ncbi:MAG: PQQ-dependent sugar dehydrogenase [Candidatus Nitrosocosmicus sp.]|nr:PQQ-dependent sugar dehydrogenase [Candidatus Nitrosocosmicus sp.]MDN5866840.1 PQQ-dependent sugar dehydrogenase [Candidatus Nitrosocosmicus sp.]
MKRYVILSIAIFITIFVFITLKFFDYSIISNYVISQVSYRQIEVNPVYRSSIKVELYSDGLSYPTSMVFVDNRILLVLEKEEGNIRLISDGLLRPEPLIKIQNLSTEAERGLLGLAVLNKNDTKNSYYSNNHSNIHSVPEQDISESDNNENLFESSGYRLYLYFTERAYDTKSNNDSTGDDPDYTVRNRVYEYTWDGTGNLSGPRLIMDISAEPGPYHNGGKMKIDKDGILYVVMGDLTAVNNALQNYPGGPNHSNFIPSNSSVIVRIDPSINSYLPKDNPFYEYSHYNNELHQLSFYYSYGIRNSFGIDIDPVTGNLWDTENGEDIYDEINLVEPGFNSGWYKVMGPLQSNNDTTVSDLVMLKGSHYSDPEFSWKTPIGITDIEFLKSPNIGADLVNNVFVGDINNGNLYYFVLNSYRSGIDINSTIKEESNRKGLEDLAADDSIESGVIFAKGFDGRITDIETGPEGNLYVLTYFDGRIYKISSMVG